MRSSGREIRTNRAGFREMLRRGPSSRLHEDVSRADGRRFRALTMGGKAGLIMLLGKGRKSMARSGELAVSSGKAQRRDNGLSPAHTEAEARLLSEFRSRRAVLAPYWVRASAAISWSSIGLSMNVRLIATVSRNVASVFAVTSYGVSGMTRWLHSRPRSEERRV